MQRKENEISLISFKWTSVRCLCELHPLFQLNNVTMVDHHTTADTFMKHFADEVRCHIWRYSVFNVELFYAFNAVSDYALLPFSCIGHKKAFSTGSLGSIFNGLDDCDTLRWNIKCEIVLFRV